ncbi:MAG: S41 family peptidase [Clostridia bacterium]|nr:S41 family peptidase [Clostridia bacterium]
MQKRTYIAITSVITLLAIIITFLVTYVCMANDFLAQREALEEQYNERVDALGDFASIAKLYESLPEELKNIEMYKKLAYIDMYYRSKYTGVIDEDEIVYTVANGYISGTGDMYGEYYTADDFEAVMNDSAGNKVGIGVYVSLDVDTGYIKILSVMKDGPAYKAGLLHGDIITHVEGISVAEVGYYSAVDLVAGDDGTEVKITVIRDGNTLDFTMKRAKVETETVFYHKYALDNKIGVIRIVEFNDAMPAQFKSAVSQLLTDGCTSLVFDMRNNPGGTLGSVVEVLDYLLPEGDLVYIKNARGEVMQKYTSDAGYINVPMAVLTNGNTASAAELFTSALMDYDKAVIVGEKTYGKGCGQSVLMLPDGSGLRLTTFLYDPPRSENYNGIGITPDIVVELSEALKDTHHFEYTDENDNQLKVACDALKNKN